MKTLCIFTILVALVCTSWAEQRLDLPPGIGSAQELANVLANEPESARFESVPSDTVTTGSFGSGSSKDNDPEREAAEAEFDGQIAELEKNLKRIHQAMKESEECARRFNEQKAELRSLEEQKEHLEKEKEKKILEDKLTKQMKDLSEINRMSRSLRTKFAELKRTQELIKTRMSGTRSSLSQLDADDDVDADEVKQDAANIASDVDEMHKQQNKILEREHSTNSRYVKDTLSHAGKASDKERKNLEKHAAKHAEKHK